MSAEPACLHCDQTRATIRSRNSICGTETGYEVIELDEEWPRHRWTDWTDKNLAGFGIVPEAFSRHRRTQITQMQWVACVDTTRGHYYPVADDAEMDMSVGRCYACGHRKDPEKIES